MGWRICGSAALFFLLGLLLGTVTCGAGLDSAGSENTGSAILRYALHTSKLGSRDPHFTLGSQDGTYADLLFNGLLRYRPGDARRIEPDLAREMPRFQILGKRQVWTIYLRKGVFFHSSPGLPAHEMTARDAVFSLTKAGDARTCAYSGLYEGMAFDILDDYTFTITLEKPLSPLFLFPRLANWKGGMILSQRAVEGQGYDRFLAHPVGTGPFQFKTCVPGQRLELAANPQYFRGRPKLAGVEIYFIPDNGEREAAFMAGQMDVIYGIGKPGWIDKMERLSGVKVDVFGPGYTGMFHFNTSMPPLDDIRVRRAIAAALNRRALMAATSQQLVSEVLAPMSPAFLPGGLDNETVDALGLNLKTNIGRARSLLAEAGLSEGFTLKIPVSEKRLYQQTYGVLKKELERINIRVELDTVSHSQYHKVIRENSSPIVLYFTFRSNPDAYLRGFFHSDAIVKTGKTPNTNFSNFRGVDRLLDNAFLEIDPEQQIRLWEQAQIKILSQVAVYPLFDIKQCTVRRDRVVYGHSLISTIAEYPQFDESTMLLR